MPPPHFPGQMFPPFPPPRPCDEHKLAPSHPPCFPGAPHGEQGFTLLCSQDVTSREEEGCSPRVSLGLHEVVLHQGRHCKGTKTGVETLGLKEKLPLSDISPFDSRCLYPDPFQFTVRVPRTENKTSVLGEPHKASLLGEPPWEKLCAPPPQRPRAGKKKKRRARSWKPQTSEESLPVHSILTDDKDSHLVSADKASQSGVADEMGLAPHPILDGSKSTPQAENECSPDQSLPVHWLLSVEESGEAELPLHTPQAITVQIQNCLTLTQNL